MKSEKHTDRTRDECMNWIKVNKILLVLVFFLPFCVSMCSRTDFIEGQKEVFDFPKQDPVQKENEHSALVGYIIHPTEHSISGVGLTYYLFRDGIKDWSVLLLIPICLLLDLVGVAMIFFKAKRLLISFSFLNLCFILTLAVQVLLEDGKGFLWGFWLTLAFSFSDIILLIWKRYTNG